MKRPTFTVAWILLGILAMSAALLTLGKRDDTTDPRIDSYGPSGFAAFADLLRAEGYGTASTTSPLPVFGKNDVAVVCISESEPKSIEERSKGIYRVLAEFAKGGGRIIVFSLSADFPEASKAAQSVQVQNSISGAPAKVHLRTGSSSTAQAVIPSDLTSAALWRMKEVDTDISTLVRYEDGLALTAGDGLIASNRFIDREQNADVLMNMVATIAPKGSRLVFAEATFSDSEPSLIELLGPAATGIWYQSLFLFVVIVFTLGKRFGLPEEVRPEQTGQRELVNAIADTYRRARSTRVACRAAYDRADLEVRKALKLSGDAPASERDERIPPALSLEFRRVFEATIDALPAQDAFERCRALRRQVKAFLHRS